MFFERFFGQQKKSRSKFQFICFLAIELPRLCELWNVIDVQTYKCGFLNVSKIFRRIIFILLWMWLHVRKCACVWNTVDTYWPAHTETKRRVQSAIRCLEFWMVRLKTTELINNASDLLAIHFAWCMRIEHFYSFVSLSLSPYHLLTRKSRVVCGLFGPDWKLIWMLTNIGSIINSMTKCMGNIAAVRAIA